MFRNKKKIVIVNFIFDIRFNSLTRNSLSPNGKSQLLLWFHPFLLYPVLQTEIYLFGINDRRLSDATGEREGLRAATQKGRKFAYLIIRTDYARVAWTISYICV